MTDKWSTQSDSILTASTQWDSSWPELANERERYRIFSYLEERFGIEEEIFDNFLIFRKQSAWWLLKDTPLISKAAKLKVWKIGLKVFREVGHFIKPTTRFIQAFGYRATRGIMAIDEEDLKKILDGGNIPSEAGTDNGYVIISLHGNILGLGLLIDGMVRSQIPKKEISFLSNDYKRVSSL